MYNNCLKISYKTALKILNFVFLYVIRVWLGAPPASSGVGSPNSCKLGCIQGCAEDFVSGGGQKEEKSLLAPQLNFGPGGPIPSSKRGVQGIGCALPLCNFFKF